MSMETALAALGAANAAKDAATSASTEPQNMANNGANTNQTENTQGGQESKENANNAQQSSAKTEGGVEAKASTAETPSTETPAKTEAEKAPAVSAQFAALAKKEKAIVKQQADIKARESAFAAREAAIAARETKIKESESLWETDVLRALESKGLSYQKLTEMVLSGRIAPDKAPEDPIQYAKGIEEKLRKEFADKEAKKEADAKAAAESAKKQQEEELKAAYESYRQEVNSFTKENAAEYELINMYGQQELIIDTVNGYYEKNKRVLSVKEASDLVERHLEDEAKRALTSKKFSPKNDAPVKNNLKEEPKAAQQTKTLSNNLTPTMSSTLPAATDSERMKRALAALDKNAR